MSIEEQRLDHPVDATESPRAARVGEPGPRRRIGYAVVGALLLLYTATMVAFAVFFEPNLQFFSYYVINYDQGFVRRGLAGEILDLFSTDLYFTGLLILRWLVPALFVAAITALAWTVSVRHGRSERRLMLALLIPMLPFGIVRAVMLPTPNLLGEAALALFAVGLVLVHRHRSTLIVSAVYGLAIAVLTLIHEAIPFLLALGAILAIVVLAHGSPQIQRLSAVLATAPGLVVAASVALLGRQDASAHCARLPRTPVEFTITLPPEQVLRGERQYVDYHDWTCRFITVTTNSTPLSGTGQVGWIPWVSSTLAGLAIFVITILLVRGMSGVPIGQFRHALQGRISWIVVAALLLLPVFATSSDWTRWWVAISFDVGVTYLLYASRRPESARPATRRARTVFTIAMVVLALFPALIAVNGWLSAQNLVANCEQLANDPQWVGICP